MIELTRTEVKQALQSLNWNHGRGDLTGFKLSQVCAFRYEGLATRKPAKGNPETFRFQIVGRSVKAFGRSRTVPLKFGNCRFSTRCVESDEESISGMTETERDITRKTFLGYVNRESLSELEKGLGYFANGSQGLTMAADFHVSYHVSEFQGSPCVFFRHSAIEYIFLPDQGFKLDRLADWTEDADTDAEEPVSDPQGEPDLIRTHKLPDAHKWCNTVDETETQRLARLLVTESGFHAAKLQGGPRLSMGKPVPPDTIAEAIDRAKSLYVLSCKLIRIVSPQTAEEHIEGNYAPLDLAAMGHRHGGKS